MGESEAIKKVDSVCDTAGLKASLKRMVSDEMITLLFGVHSLKGGSNQGIVIQIEIWVDTGEGHVALVKRKGGRTVKRICGESFMTCEIEQVLRGYIIRRQKEIRRKSFSASTMTLLHQKN